MARRTGWDVHRPLQSPGDCPARSPRPRSFIAARWPTYAIGAHCLATVDPRAKMNAGVPGCAVTRRDRTMLLTPEQTCALLKACSCADEIATPIQSAPWSVQARRTLRSAARLYSSRASSAASGCSTARSLPGITWCVLRCSGRSSGSRCKVPGDSRGGRCGTAHRLGRTPSTPESW